MKSLGRMCCVSLNRWFLSEVDDALHDDEQQQLSPPVYSGTRSSDRMKRDLSALLNPMLLKKLGTVNGNQLVAM